MNKAYFHLPGLFEFNELYKRFISLFFNKRDYFYDFVEISSIYGSPSGYIWSGGRVSNGEDDLKEMFDLLRKYNISLRLTFSNSLLKEEHLSDLKCNKLVKELNESDGIIIHSDLLLNYLKANYPKPYFVSSTTKVITDFKEFVKETDRDEFKYVVPDFRFNKAFKKLETLNQKQKDKVEFLVNECCYIGCQKRKECYRSVSLKNLGIESEDFICDAPNSNRGYVFSGAMKNPSFISVGDIKNRYLPMGFSNFKIEGRGLGSALVFEILLYYLVKPEYQLKVREEIYLDADLDIF